MGARRQDDIETILVGDDLLEGVRERVVEDVKILVLQIILDVVLVQQLVSLFPLCLPSSEYRKSWSDLKEYIRTL